MSVSQYLQSDSLIDVVKSYLTPNVFKSASSLTGESESSVHNTMHSGVATLLGGLTGMASSPEGISGLGNLTRDAGSMDMLGNITSAFSGGSATSNLVNQGGGMLGKIFGNRGSSVTDALARSGGVSSGSAKTLMSLLAPITLGALGKFSSSRGLSNSGLANMLLSQKDEIAAAAPSSVSQYLGFGQAKRPVAVPTREATTTTTYATSTPVTETKYSTPVQETRYTAPVETTTTRRTVDTGYTAPVETRRRGGLGWLGWLLLALIAAGLLWALLGRHRPAQVAREAARQTTGAVQGALSNLTLPNGTQVSVPQGSINYNLAQYLADGSQAAPRTFTFDHLNFETGSTQLTADSSSTVTSLGQILKAYPNAKVELAGHTDNTGNAAANQQLSQSRADAVKQLLVNDGIDANRITATGYGQEHPIASNDSEEGRARNRRLDLTVTSK